MARSAFAAESCLVAEFRPSPNHGERKDGRRPDMILLHYTGMPDATEALERLCTQGSDVSAHYFVFEDGRIKRLYWVQFEGYLPSNTHTYDYKSPKTVNIGRLDFFADALARNLIVGDYVITHVSPKDDHS